MFDIFFLLLQCDLCSYHTFSFCFELVDDVAAAALMYYLFSVTKGGYRYPTQIGANAIRRMSCNKNRLHPKFVAHASWGWH